MKKNQTRSMYRRLLGFLYPYRMNFICAISAMGVYGLTDGAVPYILKRVQDDIFSKHDVQLLWSLVALILVFAVVRGVFGFLEKYLIASVGLNIVRDMRNAIARHLLTLDTNFLSQEGSGALVSKMTNDTLLIRASLVDAVGSVLRDAVRIVALLAMAIYLDPVLGAIVFIGFPLGVYPVLKFGRKVRRWSRSAQEKFGRLTGLLQELVLGHKVVQGFNQEEREYQRFLETNAAITSDFKRAERYGAMSGPSNEILASLAIAGVILYGGFSVISGVRTAGDFIAFITSVFLLYEPVKKLGRVNITFQSGMAAAERFFELLDTKSDLIEVENPVSIARGKTLGVEFRSVWYRYPDSSQDYALSSREPAWALRDISFKLQAGETVALVGQSGGGKSTIANLLPRFFDPQEGAVLIDGIDIRDYKLSSLRDAVSVVSQNTFLFNHSALYNIRYGRPEATEEEAINAAKAAHAHEFISALPDAYQTVLGDQGFRLSGGERARLAIARALLKDAPILILDEATASLDNESEYLVQQALDLLMSKRSVLVIAHRLSTIVRADRILLVRDGRIVEEGNHQELLSRNGEYSRLYNLQFREAPELCRA